MGPPWEFSPAGSLLRRLRIYHPPLVRKFYCSSAESGINYANTATCELSSPAASSFLPRNTESFSNLNTVPQFASTPRMHQPRKLSKTLLALHEADNDDFCGREETFGYYADWNKRDEGSVLEIIPSLIGIFAEETDMNALSAVQQVIVEEDEENLDESAFGDPYEVILPLTISNVDTNTEMLNVWEAPAEQHDMEKSASSNNILVTSSKNIAEPEKKQTVNLLLQQLVSLLPQLPNVFTEYCNLPIPPSPVESTDPSAGDSVLSPLVHLPPPRQVCPRPLLRGYVASWNTITRSGVIVNASDTSFEKWVGGGKTSFKANTTSVPKYRVSLDDILFTDESALPETYANLYVWQPVEFDVTYDPDSDQPRAVRVCASGGCTIGHGPCTSVRNVSPISLKARKSAANALKNAADYSELEGNLSPARCELHSKSSRSENLKKLVRPKEQFEATFLDIKSACPSGTGWSAAAFFAQKNPQTYRPKGPTFRSDCFSKQNDAPMFKSQVGVRQPERFYSRKDTSMGVQWGESLEADDRKVGNVSSDTDSKKKVHNSKRRNKATEKASAKTKSDKKNSI